MQYYGVLITVVQCSPLIGLNTGLSHSSDTGTHLYETVINLRCDTGMYINNHGTHTIDVECGVNSGDVTQGQWSIDVDDIECIGKKHKYVLSNKCVCFGEVGDAYSRVVCVCVCV